MEMDNTNSKTPMLNNVATTRRDKQNPLERASFISRITFSWLLPIYRRGHRKPFQEEDLFDVLTDHKSSTVGEMLYRAWENEKQGPNPSLTKTLFKVFGRRLIMPAIIIILLELVFKIIQTLALGNLIQYFAPNQQDVSKTDAFIYAAVISLCAFGNILFGHTYVIGLNRLGLQIRIGCNSLVYRKIMTMSTLALQKTTTGQIINLVASDVSRLDPIVQYIHNFWVAPIQAIVIMYLVYNRIGWTGLVGLIFILIFFPLQILVGKRITTLRERTALKTDGRVKLMNEIINGIKIIKMYAWEKPFIHLVDKARRLEIKQVKAAAYLNGIVMSITNFLGNLALLLSITAYLFTGNSITAAYVYVLSSFYNSLRQAMTIYLPRGVTILAECRVSIDRIQKFLLLEDATEPDHQTDDNHNICIKIKDGNYTWDKDHHDYFLTDINLEITRGLLAIIGHVGCGKTSLLQVILRELLLSSGSVEINGSVSYCSQNAWLFGSTIKDNIIFNDIVNPERYKEVIRVCCLEEDFSLFPDGDLTIIGERGLTLSGGQKARIGLARAVYRKADIYLLDDPLSAVDIHIAKQIFKGCITNFLRGKCVVLVTNQLHLLNSVDRIVLIHKGRIVEEGVYNNIVNNNYFKQLSVDEQGLLTQDDKKDNAITTKSDANTMKILKENGTVNTRVYSSYLKAGGSIFSAIFVFLLFILAQISSTGSDYYLAHWTNKEQQNNTLQQPQLFDNQYLFVYGTLVISTVMVFLIRSFIFYNFCTNASVYLHDRMFSKIVGTAMNFFYTHSSGRILNRFSKDIGAIDETLPLLIMDAIQIFLSVLGIMGIVSMINPVLVPVSILIVVVFYYMNNYYLETSRNLKRLEGLTRSPVLTHISQSLQGLTTIRSFGAQNMALKHFDDQQDHHSSAYFLFVISSRGFGFWLDFICVSYVSMVTISVLFMGNDQYGGDIGLLITQTIMLTAMFQWGIRQWGEIENHMTSVERVLEYTNLDMENNKDMFVLDEKWPIDARIEYVNVSLKYNDKYVIKDVNIKIRPKEKIGIVGRTGAGKTSLITALFQLTPIEGVILIDDISIADISLQISRSKMSIIPQDPILFAGTLRKNLDPFDQHRDHEVWNVLALVELKPVIDKHPSGLSTLITEEGSNFSVGQRQLLCLARAILRKNKILILDEATSNVDPKTDNLIQKTIREQFKECTVLTIAHRLNTVIDSDRILVMDNGRVKEFDHPYTLLKSCGVFYDMVQQLGNTLAAELLDTAESNFRLASSTKQIE